MRADDDIRHILELLASFEARIEGQRAFALGGEQALGGQDPAQLLQAGQQVPGSHGADVVELELEAAPTSPEGRASVGDHPQPLGQLPGHGALGGDQVAPVHRRPQGHLTGGVAQGEEGHAGAAIELDDLGLYPHPRHLADIGLNLGRQQEQGPRVVGRGLAGQAGRFARGGGVGARGVGVCERRGGGGLRIRLLRHVHHCATPAMTWPL